MRNGEFPTRANCDPNNPEEAFLWMFVALPMVKGAPLLMPIEYYRHVSKRLWDLGARPTEEPTLQWVAPSVTEPNWMTSPGRWVPAGSEPISEEQQALDAVGRMSGQQRGELYTALCRWELGDPLPETVVGAVVNTLSEHQRSIVLKALRDVGVGSGSA